MDLTPNTAVAVKPKPVAAKSRPQKTEKKGSTKKGTDKKTSSTTKKKSSIKNTMKALAIATPIVFSASTAIAETNTSNVQATGNKLAQKHKDKAAEHGKKAEAHGKKALQHRKNAREAAKAIDMHKENARIAKDFGGREDALRAEYIKEAKACKKRHGKDYRSTKEWASVRSRIANKQKALTMEAFKSKNKVDDGFAQLSRQWLVKYGVPAGQMPTLAQLKAAAGARSAAIIPSKTDAPKVDPKTTFQSKTDSKG